MSSSLPRSVRHVACGSAARSAPEDALRLKLHGTSPSFSVDVAGLDQQLTTRVAPRFRDLIRLASYVLVADQAVTRGEEDSLDLGKRWRREFKFVVGVEDLNVWDCDEMRDVLESTLHTLTDDFYTFEFVPQLDSEPEQLNFGAVGDDPFLPLEGFASVQLFSGGMDSFTGAAEEILGSDRDVILVSHRSATKTWKLQRDLIDDLRQRAPSRRILHVAVSMVKHAKELRRERTQRSRSFLYAALAGTVANLVGLDFIRFYENGIVGMNLPVLPQVIGTRATRTTHPEVLRGFSKILSLLGSQSMRVENPFEFLSRAEVAGRLNGAGAIDVLSKTVSCAHVHKSSKMHPHCGVCSQCVDRRISMLAAGFAEHDPAEGYAVDILRGQHPTGEGDVLTERDRTMIVGYVHAADRFRDLASPLELQHRYPEVTRALLGLTERYVIDADEALRRVYEVHKRHGDGVGRAVETLFDSDTVRALRKPNGIPADSLPALLGARGLGMSGSHQQKEEVALEIVPADAEHVFRRQGQNWTLKYRGGKPLIMKHTKGLNYISFLFRHPSEELTAFALIDLDEGREVGRHSLSTSFSIDAKTLSSVKGKMRELKSALADAIEYCDDAGAARIRAEIETLEDYVSRETGLGGKVRRESPDRKRARSSVSNAITRAIGTVRKEHPAFADYLKRQIQTGFFLQYRDVSTHWLL
ncbi:MAG: hypothetical protein ACRBN8_38945 [Nannocystales bacterium]